MNLPAIHLRMLVYVTNKMNLMLCKQDWSKFSLDWVLAARCVRVIHAQCVLQFALLSRTLLRSSSNNEPSDPPYRIIFFCFLYIYLYRFDSYSMTNNNDLLNVEKFKWQAIHIIMTLTHWQKNEWISVLWWLVIYIMVRHNHTHECVSSMMWLCEGRKYCLLMIVYMCNQKRTVMIHTQVHLRIPCYDFYFL